MAKLRLTLTAGLLASALTAFAPSAIAYTTTVLGTNADAQECYRAAKMEKSTARTLKTCSDAIGSGELSQADRAATYVNRGILHKLDDNIEDAWNDYKTALKISPDHPGALANRGNLYFIAGYYEQALEDYDAALAGEMKNTGPAELNRAMTLGWLGRHAEADAQFTSVIESYPNWQLAKDNYFKYKERRADQMSTEAKS